MLAETRKALQIETTKYDSDIVGWIKDGYLDLYMAGVRLPGTVEFSESNGVYTDDSTLDDDACARAIIVYVAANFWLMRGNAAIYDQMQKAYDLKKNQLMHATGYTDWGDSGC